VPPIPPHPRPPNAAPACVTRFRNQQRPSHISLIPNPPTTPPRKARNVNANPLPPTNILPRRVSPLVSRLFLAAIGV
jgi:hypothetical protein